MYSFEEIWGRIRDNIKNPASRIEGTFTMDNAQAVAQELARIHSMEIEPMLDNTFLDTAPGIYLDRAAVDFNETRNPAVAATGELVFGGSSGLYIPVGTMGTLDGLYFSTLEAASIDASGKVTAKAECTTPGIIGNVSAETIQTVVNPPNGASLTVINPAAFEGGVEEESDEAFRARVLKKIRTPITGGNENHYVYWAEQISGVIAKCFGTWAGRWTVKVTILSDTRDAPDDTLIDRVVEKLEENKIIGVDLTVAKAEPLFIDISGSLLLDSGYSLADVTESIRRAINSYFFDIAFDKKTSYLSYHKVSELIFSAPGVVDIIAFTVSGQMSALPIGREEFCKLRAVEFNAG